MPQSGITIQFNLNFIDIVKSLIYRNKYYRNGKMFSLETRVKFWCDLHAESESESESESNLPCQNKLN
jgi:hypothetical protein